MSASQGKLRSVSSAQREGTVQPEVLTFGSLFSGCGGFDSGLEDAGFRCAWQVEIDPKRRDVLRYHWPEIPKFGDIREVSTDELAPVRLIAGGSPCQDLSVAGKREGLDGERSGLFHEFVRIADSQPSAWVLWENVDGALSSNGGGDFGIVLRELTGFWPSAPAGGWRSSGVCVGPKRWVVWRVLDSEYFGVPQRRYRIFAVGGPRNGSCAPEVLLEPGCLPGNPPPSRQARAGVAGALTSGAGERGWRVGADEAAAGQLVPIPYLAQITSGENRANPQPGDPAPALNGDPRLTIAFTERGREGGRSLEWQEELAYALTAPKNGGRRQERCVAYQCHGSNVGPMGTVRAGNGGLTGGVPFVAGSLSGQHSKLQADDAAAGHIIPSRVGVRRLTLRECERLQGYRDDATRYGKREDGTVYELKDSPRYAMVGDGVTRTVAAWIGSRLLSILLEVRRAA
jgi:DNA (cytosine-5)-methyltransferase 1